MTFGHILVSLYPLTIEIHITINNFTFDFSIGSIEFNGSTETNPDIFWIFGFGYSDNPEISCIRSDEACFSLAPTGTDTIGFKRIAGSEASKPEFFLDPSYEFGLDPDPLSTLTHCACVLPLVLARTPLAPLSPSYL